MSRKKKVIGLVLNVDLQDGTIVEIISSITRNPNPNGIPDYFFMPRKKYKVVARLYRGGETIIVLEEM